VKGLLQTAKRAIRTLMGQDFSISPDYRCAFERFGSGYGGWDVVSESLGKSSVVYSFGVGEDASFDIALIERFGMDVHAFDPTPKSIAWVLCQGFPSEFRLHEYGLANFDGNVSFNPPENPDHVSHTILDRPETEGHSISVPMKRLTTIMRELGHARIDLLKLDIEGAEYGVIDELGEFGIRPQQLLVEFHHRFPGVGVQKSRDAIAVLKSLGYGLFSVSPTGEEYSFFLRTA
jgi:FkbM family methyltransferase